MNTPFFWVQLIFARSAQFLGNFLKIFFIAHHKLFPNQRFKIPAKSGPWFSSKKPKNIPRIFWQTNYTNQVTLPVYVNYLWNRLLTPTFEHRYALDPDCETFIRNNFSEEIFNAYKKLNIGAAKADFWRCLVLLKHGGIYLDMDAGFCWPPEWFLKNQQKEFFIRNKEGFITNYLIAATPLHNAIATISEQIQQNIDQGLLKSIYDMTGPTVFHNLLTNREDLSINYSKGYVKQGLFTRKEFQYPNNLNGYWVTEEERSNPK